ncbi:MAG: hypothetical protein J6T15_04690 [Bacilli bacterium]|nr:hypothetical protein [Bacilli bacterium]
MNIYESVRTNLNEVKKIKNDKSLLQKVLDTAENLGWTYSEVNYAGDEKGYEFYQYSPAGEDFSFSSCYGSESLSDDEKGRNLIKDIVDYANDFDTNEHAGMLYNAGQEGFEGVPDLDILVDDAKDIDNMLQDLANELEKINDVMNESYTYFWQDDIEEVDYSEDNDEIWYAVASNMCEKEPEEYGDDPTEVMSDIISIWKIEKRSRLYKYLLKWYGSEEKLLDNVRDVYETDNAIYFVTGCGYSIFSADLLGGTADGNAGREFDAMVRQEEGLNEGVLEPKYSSRKSFYGKAGTDSTAEGNVLTSYGTPIMRIKDGNVEMLCGEWALTSTTLRHIREFMQQNGLEPLSKRQLIDLINKKGLRESKKDKESDKLFKALVNSDKFIKQVEKEKGLKNLTSKSGEVIDRAEEYIQGDYEGALKFAGLKESKEDKEYKKQVEDEGKMADAIHQEFKKSKNKTRKELEKICKKHNVGVEDYLYADGYQGNFDELVNELKESDSFNYNGYTFRPVGNFKSNKNFASFINRDIDSNINNNFKYDDFYKVAPEVDLFTVDELDNALVMPGSNGFFRYRGTEDDYIPMENLKSKAELNTVDNLGYIGDEYDKEIVDDILGSEDYGSIAHKVGWALNRYQLYNLATLYINDESTREKIEELLTDINYHSECSDLMDNPEAFRDSLMTSLSESATVVGKKILKEAPTEEQEDEEFVLADGGISDNSPEKMTAEETGEEMSDTEYEEEAEDDAKDIVKDDIEEPFYATVPEYDELREVLVDLDYRLLLINDDIVCIGRLNGPDIEILTSNHESSDDINKSESNDKSDEIEERAEENEEDSYEYLWIKAPKGSLEDFLKQVNVLYLSPEMSEEDKEQYAGLEANHESVMNYLMNELPEDKRKDKKEEETEEEVEEETVEEPTEEVSTETEVEEEK